MKTSDFSFDLPDCLIAQYPPERRGQSRLMLLDRVTGKREHSMVEELPAILAGKEFAGDTGGLPLLVFNNSKVRKARIIGKSLQTGAQVEFLLLERNKEERGGGCVWKVMARRAKRRRVGDCYAFFDVLGVEVARAEIVGLEGEFRLLAFDRLVDDDWLERYGHIPLPPYIRRGDESADADRYQTVYADAAGSAAAPTAGLHFTRELLERLEAGGIECVFITLHVGLGTFLPVRSEYIEDHSMHEEQFFISDKSAAKIEQAKAGGRRVIAVGTTSVRTLESAWVDDEGQGRLRRGGQATSIFIYPGYQFKIVDCLFTNFHTPESTLLMLVSAFVETKAGAFAGRELILESYAEAIRGEYRFFSYGDAMLIH
ncbi:S-adenosylmethionine:tRNA ribosyltransferase-isomerase [Spirochaetia bacterium]|nr:S-adenosylmethionine:tRNA ribosyltransferase-isomerase [Spirochaetia bacterium]